MEDSKYGFRGKGDGASLCKQVRVSLPFRVVFVCLQHLELSIEVKYSNEDDDKGERIEAR